VAAYFSSPFGVTSLRFLSCCSMADRRLPTVPGYPPPQSYEQYLKQKQHSEMTKRAGGGQGMHTMQKSVSTMGWKLRLERHPSTMLIAAPAICSHVALCCCCCALSAWLWASAWECSSVEVLVCCILSCRASSIVRQSNGQSAGMKSLFQD
jgi:hypothetical protein